MDDDLAEHLQAEAEGRPSVLHLGFAATRARSQVRVRSAGVRQPDAEDPAAAAARVREGSEDTRERIPLATRAPSSSRGEVYPALAAVGVQGRRVQLRRRFRRPAERGDDARGARSAQGESGRRLRSGSRRSGSACRRRRTRRRRSCSEARRRRRGRCSERWATPSDSVAVDSGRHGERRAIEGSRRRTRHSRTSWEPQRRRRRQRFDDLALPGAARRRAARTSGARAIRSTVRCESSPSIRRCRSSRAPWRCVNVPYEPLRPGRADGCSMSSEAEDADRTRICDLEDRRVLIQQGYAPSRSDSRFQQQMVYAVCSSVYAAFKAALGRDPVWGFERDRAGRGRSTRAR